ncbi:LytTR family DNA-binding domain-containing protein [Collinsella sp. An2]|uniref:LytR/AlgR family response regulator transcription factor n=1 Tax=Collinsella sp. An2 TaxID=1965585 RepID=UPI000B37CB1A|nr:LytTR family DNA-binding domain-containing protein [Collinsella sp. An2]OUP09840.1 hypothetical protein B5F33_04445 [Collinsella sp. An2]
MMMSTSHLTVQRGSALVRLPLASIIYLESQHHYLVIHTPSGAFRLREKISAYAARLAGEGFTRIHRYYVVNDAWVSRRSAAAVELTTGDQLPVGRRYRL